MLSVKRVSVVRVPFGPPKTERNSLRNQVESVNRKVSRAVNCFVRFWGGIELLTAELTVCANATSRCKPIPRQRRRCATPKPHSRRSESRPRNFNPTVAKDRDRGVLFSAGGEIGRVIPRFSKGLRRWLGGKSLSPDVARDTICSHARPCCAPFPAQTLGSLSVSRRLS